MIWLHCANQKKRKDVCLPARKVFKNISERQKLVLYCFNVLSLFLDIYVTAELLKAKSRICFPTIVNHFRGALLIYIWLNQPLLISLYRYESVENSGEWKGSIAFLSISFRVCINQKCLAFCWWRLAYTGKKHQQSVRYIPAVNLLDWLWNVNN